MARIDTLAHFLTDIADAIREVEGSSEQIDAIDFAERIRALSPSHTKTLTSISASISQSTYTVGTSIDIVRGNISVEAAYSDDTTTDITSTAVLDVSGVNMSTVGSYSIGVSYTENGLTKTANISIIIDNI